tara:strand:- start:1253 stop:2752 length:1500 start_codon:yes stop_codon:yes gene_type:complete
MAHFVNNFLQLLNPNQMLKDFAHASRLYIDNQHRLEPKRPFLYYVVINKMAGAAGFGSTTNQLELGQLVKEAQLPSYNFNVETQNQYNRKTQKQTQITYDPVQIQFHDDNADVVVGFFNDYYKYYYRDSKYGNTQFDPMSRYKEEFTARWGLDNDQNMPFLRDIQLFTINKRRFTNYSLILPTITAFAHDTVGQQRDGTLGHTMTVAYEAVLISQGTVGGAGPTGFTTLHYDNSPSPLTIAGGGSSSIFGTGGLVEGGVSAIGNILSGNPRGILEAINVYRNYRTGGYKAGAGEEINGIIKRGVTGIRTTNVGGSSSPGVVFPRKQRKTKVDAVLQDQLKTSYRLDDELPNENASSLTKVNAVEANAYAVANDDTRLLTPDETFTYFKNNFVALDGLARDFVYRSENQDSDDVNSVKTNYDALGESVKAGYRAKALGKAKDLAIAGQVALLLPVNQIAEINSIANNDLGSYTVTKDGDTVTETYTDDDGVVTTYNNSAV